MNVSTKLKLAGSMLMIFLFNISLSAQEIKGDIDIKIGKEDAGQWYTNPIFLIVGAAVFILLLVALVRGKSKN